MALKSRTIFFSLLAALITIAYTNLFSVLNTIGGRVSPPQNDKYAVHKALNNERCWKNYAGKACEDVKIHSSSGTAFLACGDADQRMKFYPPIQRFEPDSRSHIEYFVKYDLEHNTTIRLTVEGWDPKTDLVLHGLDLWQSDNDPSKVFIYAVNHARDSEGIALFSHNLRTDKLQFLKLYRHSLIKTPNAVAAMGKSSFFVSNDHYFLKGVRRRLEVKYGPWRWASNVVYCSEVESAFVCKVVSPPNSHASANGLAVIEQGKTLVVNDVIYGTTTVYDVELTTKMLSLNKTIFLGTTPDNLSEISGSGDIIVSVYPDIIPIIARTWGDGPLNHDLLAPAAVLRLSKHRAWEPELIYWDDGSLGSMLTGSAVDDGRHKLIAGGIWERHFLVCDI